MILTQPTTQGLLLHLPLCPSTNRRTQPVRMGGACREVLTREARDYIETVGAELRTWARAAGFVPIACYSFFDLWVVLPRTNCDGHNYGKVLFDTLEVGGIVVNDKLIIPRYSGYGWDSERPGVTVRLPRLAPAESAKA